MIEMKKHPPYKNLFYLNAVSVKVLNCTAASFFLLQNVFTSQFIYFILSTCVSFVLYCLFINVSARRALKMFRNLIHLLYFIYLFFFFTWLFIFLFCYLSVSFGFT